ncbi:MAG TPA: hypothetical protein PLV92_30730, partial [Pirellulaceae bacterium]|nr:hypothetical protein [Pirellulaceae bacterium]
MVLSGIAIFTPKGHDVAADKSPGTGLAPDLRQSLEVPSSPPESDVDPEQRRAALVEFIELGGKVRCDQSGESFSSVDKLPDRAIPLLRLFFTEGMPTPDAERLDAITSKLKPYWIE